MTMPINSAAEDRSSRHNRVKFALMGAAIFAASYGGIALVDRGVGAAPIWIANAILIYFILSSPRRETWPIITVGSAARFFAGLAIGSTLLSATVLTLCNLVEIVIVALPLRELSVHRDFARSKSLLGFYALAVGPAPCACALLAAAFDHYFRGADFWPIALNWYAADALGLIVIVPILCTVRLKALMRMFRFDQVGRTLLYLSTVVVAIIVNRLAFDYPLTFLFFPAVLFLTFQRSFEGGAIGLVMVTCYLISPIFHGGPIGGVHAATMREQIVVVEIFIAVIAFSVVLVGAALEERRKLEDGLSAARARAQTAREEAVVAKDAAENANRMKSMFLATMSHELRTPLNAVIGFSQLMETETFGPLGDAHYREYTGLIQRAGRHLLDLINDILDMSKIEAGKFELNRMQIDLRALIGESVVLMRERASTGGVTLCEDLPSDALTANVDPRGIKQILLNLLSNAIKFTPYGGTVTVRARHANGLIAMSVQDTGVGIPADQLYRLGNPFVQLRNSAGATHEGTGLGLALVRSLSEMHGGRLKIESVEGAGTTVTVEIPRDAVGSLAA